MPIALIVGAFGQGNPGDEALLDAAVDAVDGLPGWEPLAATADPGPTGDRLGCRVVGASPAAAAGAALHADALVVAGGTLFKELHPATGRPATSLLRRGLALTGAFRARGKPVAMVGVGAAPVRERARPLVRRLAAAADLLVLRDEPSARLVVAAGVAPPVRLGADLAWCTAGLHGTTPALRPERASRTLGVAVSHLAVADGTLPPRLAEALAPLVDDGWSIELEPWQGPARLGRDALVARDVAHRLGPAASVERPPADLAEAAARTRRRTAVLALRFHAAVVAAATATPLVAVAHEPKLGALADRVRQPWLTVDRLVDDLPVAVAAAVASPGPDRAAVATERRRAAATVDLLRIVLAGEGEADGLEHLALVPDPVPA